MPFSRLSPELNDRRKITLDNVFVQEYMPFAPEGYLKVYLMGLALASAGDSNELDTLAMLLNADTPFVLEAFSYWQGMGLVNMTLEPHSVEYLPVIPQSARVKKFSKEKYKDFNDQLHVMIKDRQILPPEYNEYYGLMEAYNIEDKALLTVIGYCIRQKGPAITYPYVLAVAKNLAREGCITYDRVQEKLSQYDLYDKDLRAVLKALGLKRGADHNDRHMLLKWKNEYGFPMEVIMNVAKKVKKGGITTLDMLLGRYYENRLLSIKEIDGFNENREKLYALTRSVLKILGLRYDQLDYIIETYVTGWIAMGFTHALLEKIADYCFRRGVRDLESMNAAVAKFYKQGLITEESLDAFLRETFAFDSQIKRLFDIMNLQRPVSQRDREFYRTWTDSWKLSAELLEHAASLSGDKTNPVGYMNSVLSNWYSRGVTTVREAGSRPENGGAAAAQNESFVSRELSQEELLAMFDRLDDKDI
ncbi:MAG: DnaD domain protein [Clostridiales bacterium]|jgi:GTP-binding protein EngB required for normal cell division|nr:DnaD domain protein [Clostridiales bacterium]